MIHGKGNSITSARVAHKVKASDHSNLKIWISKQLLERFPVALYELKKGNLSENILNEIRQIIYPLYRIKKITKKV